MRVISYILSNEIWFVTGMCMNVGDFRSAIKKMRLVMPVGLGALFIALSIVVYALDIGSGFISFGLGLLACFAVVISTVIVFENRTQSKAFRFLANYTMPIFLMHTLFAASLRAVLLKVGIQNTVMHVVAGLAIGFVGPIVAAVIMKKLKWPAFFLYPGKYIKI